MKKNDLRWRVLTLVIVGLLIGWVAILYDLSYTELIILIIVYFIGYEVGKKENLRNNIKKKK